MAMAACSAMRSRQVGTHRRRSRAWGAKRNYSFAQSSACHWSSQRRPYGPLPEPLEPDVSPELTTMRERVEAVLAAVLPPCRPMQRLQPPWQFLRAAPDCFETILDRARAIKELVR